MEDPKVFERGCEHFDAGEYFEAHEVWEDLWNDASGARHAYLQGLIQVAVALHHASNENWRGTRSLLGSALGYLEKGRSAAAEVDIDRLVDAMAGFELELQKVLAGEPAKLPFFPLPRLVG